MRGRTRLLCLIVLVGCACAGNAQATDICGAVSGVLDTAGSPYRATCDLTIGFAETLVVEAGVELRFTAGSGLAVEGELQLIGTAGAFVTLTSDLGVPAPGDWDGIVVSGTASMDWAAVSYGGGIDVTGSLAVADSIFEFNGGAGDPAAISFGAGNTGSVVRSLFDQNPRPLFLAIDANPALSSLAVKPNHTVLNGIEVSGGSWAISRNWTDAGAPYAFNAPTTFGAASLQTLEAGAIFKLLPPDPLTFGELTVLGTQVAPVIITSIHDDTAGGPTFPGAMTSPAPGDWGDLTVEGPADLAHILVRYGSGTRFDAAATVTGCRFSSNNGGVNVVTSAQFSNCVFEFNQTEPALSFGFASTGSVADSVFDANDQPILLNRNADPLFANLTIKPNHTVINGVQVVGGNWSISRIWGNPGVPYVPDSTLTFSPGTTQTLTPGLVFKIFPTGPPQDSIYFYDLVAPGTTDRPITFTSLGDLGVGGDTYPAGLPDPVPGDWGPLEIGGTGDLNEVTVRYGTSVELFSASTVDNSRIISTTAGVVVHNSSTFYRTQFIANGVDAGNPALTFLPGRSGAVVGGLFHLNYLPVFLGVSSSPTLAELDVLATHTLINGIRVEGGAWSGNHVWADPGTPYMPDGDIQFSAGSTQTFEAGVIFKFIPFGGPPLQMTVGKILVAGTPWAPVYFTSALDPSVAPNAWPGGTGAPAPGDWDGLTLSTEGSHAVSGARIGFAASGIRVDGVSSTIDGSRFYDNQRGIDVVSAGFARVTRTDFINNDRAVALDDASGADLGDLGDVDALNDGLNNFVCNLLHVENLNTNPVPAENNWWNDTPPDPTLVVGPVDDDPFLPAVPRPVLESLTAKWDPSTTDLLLEWADQAPTCGYRVYRSTSPNSGFVAISGFVTGTSFTDSGAAPAPENYFYRVLVD